MANFDVNSFRKWTSKGPSTAVSWLFIDEPYACFFILMSDESLVQCTVACGLDSIAIFDHWAEKRITICLWSSRSVALFVCSLSSTICLWILKHAASSWDQTWVHTFLAPPFSLSADVTDDPLKKFKSLSFYSIVQNPSTVWPIALI